jgi:poly-gamma-glutamate capsule biosynthesis protein CapA/YwtB (metallophosphatase superfamily)
VPDGFTFAAGGDLLGPYTEGAYAADPAIAPLTRIFRAADLGYANQEGAIFDLAAFPGSPAAENGGGTPIVPVANARALRSIGVTVVSKANNHATDWGHEGLAATLATLEAAGIAQAGSGSSLAEARAPTYVETRSGTAALVSTASTFPPMSVAGDPIRYRGAVSRPRPGISGLRVRAVRSVSRADLATLRRIAGASAFPTADRADEVRIGDILYRAGATPLLGWETAPGDEAAVLASLRAARAAAGFVLFAIHAHETGGDEDAGPANFQPAVLHFANEAAGSNDPRPADFQPRLFHAAIDAGADAVVRTGPHLLGGVEIYRGKPIFYGLGSLIFDFGGRRSLTTAAGETFVFPDVWFETMVPVTRYRAGRIDEVRLYPFLLQSSSGPGGGLPHPAPPAEARRILERVQALSAPHGTVTSPRPTIYPGARIREDPSRPSRRTRLPARRCRGQDSGDAFSRRRADACGGGGAGCRPGVQRRGAGRRHALRIWHHGHRSRHRQAARGSRGGRQAGDGQHQAHRGGRRLHHERADLGAGLRIRPCLLRGVQPGLPHLLHRPLTRPCLPGCRQPAEWRAFRGDGDRGEIPVAARSPPQIPD